LNIKLLLYTVWAIIIIVHLFLSLNCIVTGPGAAMIRKRQRQKLESMVFKGIGQIRALEEGEVAKFYI
jgi:hypothetical protein